MKKLLTLLAVLSVLFASAQNPGDNPGTLPAIIPPSPDISSLNKAGSISTSLHTGAASANIPMYELSVGSIKLPIALSYSTNGVRVNDIASRVGLGWNLIAGGTINRTVHDEDDDGSLTTFLTPPSFTAVNQATLDYLFYATQEGYDTEHDDYSFSVNGMSGKFFFDANGVIRIANHNNLKIVRQGNTFTLTTAEGIVYTFGGTMLEKTKDVKTNGNPRANKVKTTAWFLTGITSPEGDQVTFTYSSELTIRTKLGPYQSVIMRTTQPGYPGAQYPDCGTLCAEQWPSVQYNMVDYDTRYLTQITTSNSQRIDFIYENRPDNSGDKRLTGVNIYSLNDVSPEKLIKKYVLEYENSIVGTDLNQRFFLKKVTTHSTDVTPRVLSHQFQYNDPSTLGRQDALTQDYYGFSRADGNATPSGHFIPRPLNYNDYANGFQAVDRSPVFDYAKAGALKKVIYPTGGTEEFEYEPHTIPETNTVTSNVYANSIIRKGPGTGFDGVVTRTQQFTVTTADVKIQHITHWNPAGPNEGTLQYWTPDGIHGLSFVEIWNMSTNQRVYYNQHLYYATTENLTTLTPGVTYELRLKVRGNSHYGEVYFYYNPSVQTHTYTTNVTACGIRVKNIRAYDPVSNRSTTKYYTYAAMNAPTVSSGVGYVSPGFFAAYQGGGVCHDPFVLGDLLYECPGGLLQASSSSLTSAFTFNGSPIAYATVLESDDPDFANGAIEHKFATSFNPQQALTVLGTTIAGASVAGPLPDMNGMELETNVYKKGGNNIVLIKKTANTYVDGGGTGILGPINYTIRKRWGPPSGSNFSFDDKAKGYDVNSYVYVSKWIRLDNTVTTDYDEDGLNPMSQTITYAYNNEQHTQPTQITTVNSKGESILRQMKYPADFTGTVYNGMVASHIVSPVIETSTTNNSSLVSLVRTDYGSWTGGIYKPTGVKIQNAAGNLENRVVYHAYDNEGNPLELSKDNGERVSYIWNYKKTYPVAEVKNASHGDIAYTSFEGDTDGGWTVNGVRQTTFSMTGEKSLTGLASRTVNSSKVYTVTLWAKDSHTPYVNNATGELLATHNGWKLYRWEIKGVSLVEVEGFYLDEVRLYPSGAQMSTYTFTPFVGMTSSCDVNNTIKYYSYDGYNRLSLIKDMDRNIIKKICYTYTGEQENCEPGVFYNTEQYGFFTKQCPSGSVGSQVKYVVPANTHSSTISVAFANQTAAFDVANNGQAYANTYGTCTVVCNNCTGNDKKCINGVCETGTWSVISTNKVGSTWYCTYAYCFSDQSHSSYTQTVANGSPCVISCF